MPRSLLPRTEPMSYTFAQVQYINFRDYSQTLVTSSPLLAKKRGFIPTSPGT